MYNMHVLVFSLTDRVSMKSIPNNEEIHIELFITN